MIVTMEMVVKGHFCFSFHTYGTKIVTRASENCKWSVRLGGSSALPAEQGRRGALPSLAFLTVAVKADRESVSQQREGLRRTRGWQLLLQTGAAFPAQHANPTEG